MSTPKVLNVHLSSRQLMAIHSSARSTIERNGAAIERYKNQLGAEGIIRALAEESADLVEVIEMTQELVFKK